MSIIVIGALIGLTAWLIYSRGKIEKELYLKALAEAKGKRKENEITYSL